MTDRILLEACLANDRKAQHQLYERYKNAMYTLAYRITADFELAGEALQDAFLNIFNAFFSDELHWHAQIWFVKWPLKQCGRLIVAILYLFCPEPLWLLGSHKGSGFVFSTNAFSTNAFSTNAWLLRSHEGWCLFFFSTNAWLLRSQEGGGDVCFFYKCVTSPKSGWWCYSSCFVSYVFDYQWIMWKFIIHHSSFIIHHSSFIIHHSSFIIHHSSLITHHSSLITPH